MTLNMGPCFSCVNAADSRIVYVKHGSDLSLSKPALLEKFSDSKDFSGVQFCKTAPFSFWAISSTLRNHISQVLGLSAKKQMIRVDAQLNITSMADDHAIRNRSLMYFPRNAVRSVRLPHPVSIISKLTIPAGVSARSPRPATIWGVFIDLSKKSFFQCFHKLTISKVGR